MDEIWRRGEATVRDVLEELNRGPKHRAYTTVMTTMSRLAGKGLLTRRRVGRMDVYSPALGRDAYQHARARAEIAALVEEFGDIALAHFARQLHELDAERLEALRRLARGD